MEGPLTINWMGIEDFKKRWQGSYRSVVLHILERTLDHIRDGFHPKEVISRKIILAFAQLCREQQIEFAVAGVTEDEATQEMLAFCNNQNIPTLALGWNPEDPKLNLQPYDSHPNAQAHQLMADQLLAFLQGKKNFDKVLVKKQQE